MIKIIFLTLHRKAKKLSEASEKQRRINDLLNASHNSQVERDYLRQRILEIFEEDEKALEEAEENNKRQSPSRRKNGQHSIPKIDAIEKTTTGTDAIVHETDKVDEGFESGSSDLQSRTSVEFINVPSEKVVT